MSLIESWKKELIDSLLDNNTKIIDYISFSAKKNILELIKKYDFKLEIINFQSNFNSEAIEYLNTVMGQIQQFYYESVCSYLCANNLTIVINNIDLTFVVNGIELPKERYKPVTFIFSFCNKYTTSLHKQQIIGINRNYYCKATGLTLMTVGK